ncbi:MAG: flavin reductase (DIM6/NTAB) family NADH-FMN oxidoreductase RutF, partial [Pirellulaceae bacterium]
MEFDPASLSRGQIYQQMIRIITPRPIAWVSTRSSSGIDNLAPYSYFNAVGSNPPLLMFCPANKPDGTKKDSLRNVEENGEFVVNIVSFDVAQQMNQSSAAYDTETSEFDACGLTRADSKRVKPPRVAEAKAHFECTLHTVLNLGTGAGGANLVLGNIVAFHVDDQTLGDDGFADPAKLDAVGRLGGISYCRTSERFALDRPV